MKSTSKYILTTTIAMLLSATDARAVSDTWTGAFDGDYTNAGNWLLGNIPGDVGLVGTSLDTATFSGGLNTTVSLNGDRNLKFLTWDNSAPGLGAFNLTGSTLSISPATGGTGVVLLRGMWGASSQTISSAVNLNGATTSDVTLVTAPSSGGLTINGPISSLATTGTSSISMRTGLGGGITFLGGVNNGGGTNLVQVNIAATSTGTTTFSGVNGFTGGLLAQGGKVVIADTAGAAVLASANFLRVNNSSVEFRGATSGTSSETLGNLQVNELSSSRVTLNLNGGSGMTVQVAGLAVNGTGAAGISVFNLPTGAVFKTASPITVGGAAAGVAVQNGIVMGAGGAAANGHRATYLVRDSSGLGFAMQNASNELVRYTSATTLSSGDGATVTVATSHYVINSSLTRTAALNFSTLQVDTSGGPVVIDLGTQNLNSVAGNGRTMLVTGTNDVTVNATTGAIPNTLYLLNHSTGTATLNIGTNSGQALISAGPGPKIVSKTPGGDLYVIEGTTRLTLDANYTNNVVRLYDGGVLELGADLNGVTAGDFSRGLGTAAGNVAVFGTAGFSAVTSAPGGTRTVNIGGAGATLQFGAPNWVSTAFVLSSPTANATLDFLNPLNVAGGDRVFDVRDGSAGVDGKLSGVVTNATANSPGGIYKTGAGTLEVANVANSYDGGTRVAEGRLLLSGSLSGTTSVIVSPGATFELGAADRVNNAALVKLEGGTFKTGGFGETVGALTLAGSATFDFGSGASIFAFADSSASIWTGGLSITNWSGSSLGGGTDQLFFGASAAGLSPSQVALVQFVNPDGFAPGTYTATMLPSGELVAVPEPGAVVSLLCGVGLLVGIRRRRA